MASIDARVGQREIEAARSFDEGGGVHGSEPEELYGSQGLLGSGLYNSGYVGIGGATPGAGPSSAGTPSPPMGGGPSTGYRAPAWASDTTVVPNAPAPVVSVETFEDIRAAQKAMENRNIGMSVDDFSGMTAAIARTNAMNASGLELGSVNLAPTGINVGYQSNIGKVDSFDQLDASTKAAVRAAQIQSQSEDETENAIAQMWGAFQIALNKAGKFVGNKQQSAGGFPNLVGGGRN